MLTGRTKPDRAILTPQRLTGLLAERRVQLVDIRTPVQWAQAHIRGSRNADLDALAGEILTLDRELPIVLYDNCGESAGQAAEALREAGDDGFLASRGARCLDRRWQGRGAESVCPRARR